MLLMFCCRWELKNSRTGTSCTLTLCIGAPGLSRIFPYSLTQLTTRWWSVDSFATLYIAVSKMCCYSSSYINTKLIIDLPQSLVPSECVCFGQTMIITEIQQCNTTQIQIWQAIPKITPHKVSLSLPMWSYLQIIGLVPHLKEQGNNPLAQQANVRASNKGETSIRTPACWLQGEAPVTLLQAGKHCPLFFSFQQRLP